MAKLINETQSRDLTDQLVIADNLLARTLGLLKHHQLEPREMLWIHQCNSIHTFFMKFTIDCVFLSKDLRIVSIKERVRPWRLIWPQWSAWSVIEMKSGSIQELDLKIGDRLYVGA